MTKIKEAFEKLVQVPDAWNNPMMQPVKNGFILGWEAAVLAEREACAKTCEEEAEEWSGRTEPHEAVVRCAAAIRSRCSQKSRGEK